MNQLQQLHPKLYRFLHNGAAVLIALGAMAILWVEQNGTSTIGICDVSFFYLNFFVVFFCAIGGYIPFLFGFLITFLIQLFLDMDGYSYTFHLYLIMGTIAYTLARFAWLQKWWKALLSTGVLILTEGVAWPIMNQLLLANGFANLSWKYILAALQSVLPQCFLSTLAIFLYFRYAPKTLQVLLRTGADEDMLRQREDASKDRKFGISTKITVIIFVQALILSISAAVFANSLLNTMGTDMIGNADEVGTTTITLPGENVDEDAQTESDVQTETNSQTENNAVFVFNDSALAFDLRLIMLIFNMAIPITVLADHFAQAMIARPLRRMVGSIQTFAREEEEGKEMELDYVKSLRIPSHDEIGDLQESLKNMMQSILEYQEHLLQEQKLKEDLRVAERTSQAKSDFLSSMSHEIRTPINAVLGMDEMILRESQDDAITEYATNIQNAGKTLLSLINDILDFSKMEAGKMDLIPVEYELSSTLNDLVNMIQLRAEAKHLALHVYVDSQIPHVLVGDEIRLKQVVTNILTNAVKYTKEGSVTLRVCYEKIDAESISLRFQVVDTGIGISEENIKKLYAPFERIDEAQNRSIEGTGLGMSIVKQLLDKMDSKLEVKSVYGQGSDFSFAVKQQVVTWEPMGDFTEMYEASQKAKIRHGQAFTAPDAKVLLVDDTLMNLTVAKALLKRTKVQITTAMSGEETLRLIQEQKFHVIFLDHRMPEMDGVETLKAMRRLPGNKNKETPIIALTANAIRGAKEMYLRAGFVDYLAKPIDGRELETMLQKYLPEELVKNSEKSHEVDTDSKGNTGMIEQVTGLDSAQGIQACGSPEVWQEVLKQFYETLDEKCQAIENALETQDMKTYTVHVHALKSSARLIGAGALSEFAKRMEQAGNAKDWHRIQEETPALLADCRSWKQRLHFLEKQSQEETDTSHEKVEISREDLQDAYQTMRELLEAFDFDSAEEVLQMLGQYEIPETEQEKYNEVKKWISAVDRERLLEVL